MSCVHTVKWEIFALSNFHRILRSVSIREIFSYFRKVSVDELVVYMVAVGDSYLFTCSKTSNMQWSQNNMSLQAIWLEVNWSMTDPIYSVACWLIFFCCCIWHTCNCFPYWKESLHLCYIQNTPWVGVWHNVTSKQARHIFHCFVLNSHFIQPSECKYVLCVCLSVRLQVSFIPLLFQKFGQRFSFHTFDLSRERWTVPPTRATEILKSKSVRSTDASNNPK